MRTCSYWTPAIAAAPIASSVNSERANSVTIAAVSHDENAVAHSHDLRKLRRDEQDCHSVRGERVDLLPYFGLRADIDSSCRLVKNEQGRFRVKPFAEHDLLLVSAAQRRDGRLCRSSPNVEVANVGLDERLLVMASARMRMCRVS